MDIKAKIVVLAALCLFGAHNVFPQDGQSSVPDDMAQRRSIPEELLRPRREEAPRYPVDTVIGALGRGEASREAYEFAKNIAAALLAGTMDAPILSTVNKTYLESYMNVLTTVSPRFFRIGGGREEPDGAVSFLVRFVGREQGITGELYIRFGEKRPDPPPKANDEEVQEEIESEAEDEAEDELDDQEPDSDIASEPDEEQTPVVPVEPPPPPVIVPVEKVWVFEDLILEEPRSREAENQESRQRFDFPPYERFF